MELLERHECLFTEPEKRVLRKTPEQWLVEAQVTRRKLDVARLGFEDYIVMRARIGRLVDHPNDVHRHPEYKKWEKKRDRIHSLEVSHNNALGNSTEHAAFPERIKVLPVLGVFLRNYVDVKGKPLGIYVPMEGDKWSMRSVSTCKSLKYPKNVWVLRNARDQVQTTINQDDGAVYCRTSVIFDLLENLATNPEIVYAWGKQFGFCCVCGLPLTDEVSKSKGVGPVCQKSIERHLQRVKA